MKHAQSADHDHRCGDRRNSTRRLLATSLLLLATIAVVCNPARTVRASGKPVSWKAIGDAILRIDDGPIKEWNVYQTGKKTDSLLLQMGKRFLLIEVHEKRFFELDPSKIERKSDDNVLWDPSDRPANPLASSGWTANDNGAAFHIVAKIDTEGHVLDLQLPHQLDTSSLPPHTATPRRR